MYFKNLNEFITALERENELIRIKIFVSSILEAAEINDRVVKNINKALLFENTGTKFPLLLNAMGSEKRMCMALGVEKFNDIGDEILRLFRKFTSQQLSFLDKMRLLSELNDIGKWMPRRLKGKGASQEVILENIDLNQLPVLTCWPFDGGPFITLPAVHTLDPETGICNVGMYRMQVFDNNTTGMHWHKHKDAAKHFLAYKKQKKRMPVSVSIGGPPVLSYVASAPLPENIDEYILAGFLQKKKVELVKCLTNDIYVPSNADFILEGYIDTEEPYRLEGPFGDHTGFYSLADFYPVFHITCITHRKDAIYPATVVGIPPQEDTWMAKATERIFLMPIRLTMLPELLDMILPAEGVFHNIAIVKIKNAYEGHAFKVMNSLWGAGQMMLNKVLFVVDDSVDINNIWVLFEKIIRSIDIKRDLLLSKGPLDVLDHSVDKTGYGGKLGIDATHTETNVLPDFAETLNVLESLRSAHTFIIDFNRELLENQYAILIIAVKKENFQDFELLKNEISSLPAFSDIKVVLFIEHLVKPSDYKDLIWRSANNIEPSRDCQIVKHVSGKYMLFMDGTMKTKKIDNFLKDWPNIICANDETITLVDSKWESLGIGEFIESPSRKYGTLKYSSGAIVEKPDESFNI